MFVIRKDQDSVTPEATTLKLLGVEAAGAVSLILNDSSVITGMTTKKPE